MTNRSPRLPEEIYVRRRVAAALILLVLVGLLVWGLVAFAGRGGESATTAQNTTEVTTTGTTTSRTTEASEDPEDPESTEASTTASTEPEESEAAEPKDSCELSDLRILASSDRPSYGEGDQPTFYMTVENPTDVDCELDLDAEELRFEVYNLEDNERVWADTDCFPSVLTGDESFPAGDERRFQAVWSRMGSQPGQCNSRQDVGTGAFFLHTVIGNNASDAHTFNLG